MAKPSQPQFVAFAPEPIVDGDRRMAPDLEVAELLQSQVILPFSLDSAMHAFLGPFSLLKKPKKFVPFFLMPLTNLS